MHSLKTKKIKWKRTLGAGIYARPLILDDKVIGYMKSKIKLDEKPISYDDFKTMVETPSNN